MRSLSTLRLWEGTPTPRGLYPSKSVRCSSASVARITSRLGMTPGSEQQASRRLETVMVKKVTAASGTGQQALQ